LSEISTNILIYADEQLAGSGIDHFYLKDVFIPELLYSKLKNSKIINKIYFSVPPSISEKFSMFENVLIRDEIDGVDGVDFWKDIFSKTTSVNIVKIYADSPFIDISIIEEMIAIHLEYLAEFTYSDNLPEGLACEIFSSDLIKLLPETNERTLQLGKIIKSNINQFDVELYYKEPDLRDKRISFRCSNPRDKKIMENIFFLSGNIPAYTEIKNIIEKNPQVVYIGPSYLEIELTGKCVLDCIFCYRKTLLLEHGDMSLSIFKKIISDMEEFKLPYTICFGGSGEPLEHPDFYKIAEMAIENSFVERIIVETNGINADSNYLSFLEGNSAGKIITILNFNGLEKESYTAIHGKDYFDTVLKNTLALNNSEKINPNFYTQIMKINETKSIIDKYYDLLEKNKVKIILQKQNIYSGSIADRRYSDLSPIDRVPCWHLQRDMYIISDGTVCFCKQDIEGKSARGNLNSQSIPEVWEKGKEAFISDYSGKFPEKPGCSSCDEWYTFNY
jgi:spiro-SPASM protein